jgi:hypothetical protein
MSTVTEVHDKVDLGWHGESKPCLDYRLGLKIVHWVAIGVVACAEHPAGYHHLQYLSRYC